MITFQFTLSNLLFGNQNPASWECPIQEGLPALLNLAATLLLWASAAAFVAGILIAVFNYLTAFGDENKAKKGKETLKWTLIGAVVVMLSSVVITTIAGVLVSDQEKKQVQTLEYNPLTGQQEVVLKDSEGNRINSQCNANPTSSSILQLPSSESLFNGSRSLTAPAFDFNFR